METRGFRSPPGLAILEPKRSIILVSAAWAWEITAKHRLGKLPRAGDVAQDVWGCVAGQGL